jgi:hypothetical protein
MMVREDGEDARREDEQGKGDGRKGREREA